MLEWLIGVLQGFAAPGPSDDVIFVMTVLVPIAGFVWGARHLAARRYQREVSKVHDLETDLKSHRKMLGKRDARIAELESQTPSAFLKYMDQDKADDNLEREIRAARAFVEDRAAALYRAFATLRDASIVDASEDGAIGYENARLYNMGVRAVAPRDRVALELTQELEQAAAAAASGAKVTLPTDDDRAARRARLNELPRDLQALTHCFYDARDGGRYRLMQGFDNLSSHKSPGAAGALRDIGTWFLFLPPYSPDLNPIEMAFSKLKTLIRKAAARTYEELWQAVGHVCDLFTDEECYNFFKAAGYQTD